MVSCDALVTPKAKQKLLCAPAVRRYVSLNVADVYGRTSGQSRTDASHGYSKPSEIPLAEMRTALDIALLRYFNNESERR